MPKSAPILQIPASGDKIGDMAKKKPRRIVPQPEDEKILRALYTGSLFNARQIAALAGIVYDEPLQRRLQRLYEADFVARPHRQQPYQIGPQGRYQGKRPLVYSLTQRGERHLVEKFDLEPTGRRWDRNAREVGPMHIEHELMVAQFHAVLQNASHPAGISLRHWDEGRHLQTAFHTDEYGQLTSSQQGTERHVTAPDAFVYVEKTRRGREVPRYCFLEADRSSMKLRTMFQKYRAYYLYDRFGLAAQDIHPAIKRFRVITVTKTRARAQNLCRLASYVDRAYTDIPREKSRIRPTDHEIARPPFLFVCQDAYSLEQPEKIRGNIACESPRPERMTTLW